MIFCVKQKQFFVVEMASILAVRSKGLNLKDGLALLDFYGNINALLGICGIGGCCLL